MQDAAVRKYLFVSGGIFGFVALVHAFRVIEGLAFRFGPVDVPMWGSVLGFVIMAALSGWAFSLTRR